MNRSKFMKIVFYISLVGFCYNLFYIGNVEASRRSISGRNISIARGELIYKLNDSVYLSYLKERNNDQIKIIGSDVSIEEVYQDFESKKIVFTIQIDEDFKSLDKNITGHFINKIKIYKLRGNTAIMEVYTDKILLLDFSEIKKELIVDLYRSPVQISNYSNLGDRKYFTLGDIILTNEFGDEKYFEEKIDKTDKTYEMIMRKNVLATAQINLLLEDTYFKTITIESNKRGRSLSLKFEGTENFIYAIIGSIYQNNTVINFFPQSYKGGDLVVIDPGHGGSEPGAVYKEIFEKNLNLEISLKVNEYLQDKGVKTLLIRDKDVYVGLYERALIANKLEAKLFLSIHNNAFSSYMHGTETLYFPLNSREFSGKDFANIIQNKLIRNLRMNDRGIVPRPNLVVLKHTDMIAALAEIGFITNERDRRRLLNPRFKEIASKTLAEAVVTSLRVMRR